MYAHQVLEGLQWWINNMRDREGARRLVLVSKSIISAQKFHTDFAAYNQVVSSRIGRELVFSDADTLSLPYPLTWIDYQSVGGLPVSAGQTASSRRGALLVQSAPLQISIFVFTYWDEKNLWAVFPYCVHAAKGEGKNLTLVPIVYSPVLDSLETKLRYVKDYADDFGVLSFTLRLIGCRNIATEIHRPGAGLLKKRRRSGRTPPFTYHTLVIRPTGKHQESIPKHLWENRIHLCRGHFKTYTEDKPLFGRMTGRYWWQPCVKGRNKDGVVMKDYRIEEPEPA